MAQFDILRSEGTNWVKIALQDETVRAEAGALSYMTGEIKMASTLPSLPGIIKSALADESVFRPTYSGTGEICLESSLGGFHIIDLKGEQWILESGSYWASDGNIQVSVFREKASTAFWTGEGLIQFQTKVSGFGKVVIRASGPVEEVELKNSQFLAEGKYVIGRTGDITYTVRRPTRSYFSYLLSGESYFRCFEGTGRLLVAATPYWRMRFQDLMKSS
jgi:uncharacterized protein (AIM24 family)